MRRAASRKLVWTAAPVVSRRVLRVRPRGGKERKGGERTERLAGFGEKTSDFVDERPEPFQSGRGGQRPKHGEACSGRREGRRAHALFEGRLKLGQAFFLRRGPDVGLKNINRNSTSARAGKFLGRKKVGSYAVVHRVSLLLRLRHVGQVDQWVGVVRPFVDVGFLTGLEDRQLNEQKV